ncbi:TonB-dependent siderophore receptor [Gloeobacter violaceus]|uniref:Ferrichrome-iron receptor n=1 Tax=Gloeobacter violaceus (strain ATCC 29082 / PCC 7421) TaxID=251221 RepID=Q7NNQ7_GLOVI|nr:ferrichrome-iron receptor [Gloeobacter violaceus PCC 7421]
MRSGLQGIRCGSLVTLAWAVFVGCSSQLFAASVATAGGVVSIPRKADLQPVRTEARELLASPLAQAVPAASAPEPTAQRPPDDAEDLDEVTVTGERRRRYLVPDTSTATKIDTPIRDLPLSIQVVPQQVLEDRKVRNVTEAVETVSGVVDGGDLFGAPSGARIIRGFEQSGNFRNGYRDVGYYALTGVGTIEQVEVLKGPASVLFGAVEPGGLINVVTKRPLSEPYYNVAIQAGNLGYYQPSIDLSGPLNSDKTLLYRVNANYQGLDGFQNFVTTNLTTISPTVTWKLGDKTVLNLHYEYIRFFANPPESYAVLLSDGRMTPRNLYLSYPSLAFNDIVTQKYGYSLSHQFNDDWQIRNSFSVAASNTKEAQVYGTSLVSDRFVDIDAYDLKYAQDNYFGQIDLIGKFKTGSISHQLLLGFDFNRFVDVYNGYFNTDLPALDILNPNYNIPKPDYVPFFDFYQPIQSYGVYLQDQVTFLDNLKLLVGGRLDWVSQKFATGTPDAPIQNDSAFSPRIGLVYQPSESVSLYTSYSQSFNPTQGFNPDGAAFKPTKGAQYEAGIKVDFLDRRLSTTLAAYQIIKENVRTVDPNNPLFSIQVGEQRSQGIELDFAGQVLPGWKIIGSYAYTDGEVTGDNLIPAGNKLRNVPEHQASLWTTYEIPQGNLKGLGFGLGLFYVGSRAGDLPNTFTLPDYLRTDAKLYYRNSGLNAAINIRNLFDMDYVRSSFNNIFLQRGAPLTITCSIGWEL